MNRISDGPIVGFKGGWACIPFAGGTCHYWKPTQAEQWQPVISCGGRIRTWVSLCGRVVGKTNNRLQALGVGTLTTCAVCRKLARKAA